MLSTRYNACSSTYMMTPQDLVDLLAAALQNMRAAKLIPTDSSRNLAAKSSLFCPVLHGSARQLLPYDFQAPEFAGIQLPQNSSKSQNLLHELLLSCFQLRCIGDALGKVSPARDPMNGFLQVLSRSRRLRWPKIALLRY